MIPEKLHEPVVDPALMRLQIFGPPKVGKSTLAAQNPKALIFDCDSNGTAFLKCYRVPIFNWSDLRAAATELSELRKKNDTRFNTVVIDTVDMAWQFCRQHVCKENGVEHESEDKSFGRLWDLVKANWMKMTAYIQSLGFGIWTISHSVTKELKIDGVKRTVVCTSLPDKAQKLINSACDQIIYIDSDDNNVRTLYSVPQPGIECGGRLFHQNIKFKTEKEAYEKLINIVTNGTESPVAK